ncbi:MAG: glycosyltransferase family 2 protein [Pelagibacteraceae bacterium]
MNFQDKLTIIIVTFHSNEIIEYLIKKLDKKIKILIIENSQDVTLKRKLEEIYSNVEVIIPERNLGVGAAINIGLKKVKTKYSLQLSADVVIENNSIKILTDIADKIKNFSILAPKDHDYQYGEEMYKYFKEDKSLHEMNLVAGFAILINMKIITEVGLFDEEIFLYFEEFDFCLRCNKKKIPIYLSDEVKVSHKGNSSIDKKFSHQIRVNRSWHYCWSKFYYFRKHYSYLYGIRKTLPNLLRSIKGCIYFFILRDRQNLIIKKAEIKGLLSSYFLKKSLYRPKL